MYYIFRVWRFFGNRHHYYHVSTRNHADALSHGPTVDVLRYFSIKNLKKKKRKQITELRLKIIPHTFILIHMRDALIRLWTQWWMSVWVSHITQDDYVLWQKVTCR